jgi:amino acid adenylation domain-containing protein
VTALFLTTALFNQVSREAPGAFAGLEQLLFGGELVDPKQVREQLLGSARPGVLRHVYGPTESTTFATHSAVESVDEREATVPIGRPLSNTAAYVVDGWGQPAPPGAEGELWLGGDGLARGYLGQPGATAERFVPDPFGEAGARLYRTGDRVRTRADGRLEFVGRLDAQVKLRGFRIEPAEIEAALLRQPGVREAVVQLREDRPGDRRLVGYFVGEPEAAVRLRERLAASLPEYMVPAALVALEKLPLTPTGKVDRRALPAPPAALARMAGGGETAALAAPRTAVEESLLGLWSEVLGVPRLGVHDDFFALGGHSLLATRLISRVRGVFQVELPLRDLFEAPTVAGLARRLEAARRRGLGAGASEPAPPLAKAERGGRLPLSFAQQRLWFLQQLDPASVTYNLALPLRVTGPLDLDLLDRGLTAIVSRHEVLRTTFGVDAAGEPEQRIAAPRPFRFGRIDLGSLPEPARAAELRRLAAAAAGRPFALAHDPALRGLALRLGAGEHAVLLTMHHVATDGWSMEVLTREVVELYRAGTEGRPPELPELPIQYADYALWQRRWLSGEVLAREAAHWRQALAGAPEVTALPLDRPRRAGRGPAGGSRPLDFTAEETAALQQLGRQEGSTLFMVALTGLQALLARYGGEPRVSVGTPIAGRNREELEPLIGFFVNTLVMHADLSGEPTFVEALRRVREAALTAYDHQDLPFEKLVEELDPARDRTHQPLFQVMFALRMAAFEPPKEAPVLADLRLSPLEWEGAQAAKFELTVALEERGGRLSGSIDYSRDLFDAATAGRLARHLEALLRAASAAPGVRLAEISLLDAAERHQLAAEWNDTRRAYPRRGLYGLFAAQAAARPDAAAVAFGALHTSYGELRREAVRLGRGLRQLGVGLEARVGLCMERSPEMLAATLGVLAAGGAYVPLDPGFPAERLRFMVRDAGLAVVLAALPEALPDLGCPVLPLAAVQAAGAPPAGIADEIDEQEVPAEALAYVIYTSGSTGEPKGIGVAQGAVCRLVHDSGYLRFGPGQRIGHASNIAFDAATFEIWGALLHGGVVVGIPREVALDAQALSAALAGGGVTALFLTTALFNQVSREAPGAFAGLEQLLFGGELVDPKQVRELLLGSARPGVLRHVYGPTESTTFATHSAVESVDERDATVPIGRPLSNTTAYVVDGWGQPAPPGAEGELWLGGDGLARGYLGQPGQTAETFVPDPFGEPGARLYRTGDRVRTRADGRLEFVGRLDAQVKLRGFRIEPAEIEAALLRQPGVREAVVQLREDRPGDRRLVGYFVGDPAAAVGLRERLATSLPEYMVPAALVALEKLPLTPTGKVDRRALQAPLAAGGETAALAPPRTAVEESLVGLWSEVLGVARLGVHDDFFALGGHSLLATRLISRVRGAFQVELPLRDLFEAPTVAGLARRLEAARRRGLGAGASEPAPPLAKVERGGRLPLSFAQQRLWFLQQLDPASVTYNLALPLRVTGPLDLDLLDRGLTAIVSRHEVLRTTFGVDAAGEPEQRIAAPRPFRFGRVDLGSLPEPARGAELRRLAAAAAGRPFALAHDPALRGLALRLGPGEHAVLLTMHHVATDGWSMEVLTREVVELYRAGTEGRPPRLPELPIQYADYALWQRRWLAGEVLERETAHWRQALAGAPEVTALPLDRPRRAGRSPAGGNWPLDFTAEETAALQQLGRQEGSTLFMVALTGLQALLARYAGEPRVSVGTPIAGRNREELEPLIGFFVNTLVMHADLSGEPTFVEALRRVREVALTAYDHQDLPFEKLVEELDPARDRTHQPLFQVMFAFQASSQGGGEGGKIELPSGLALAPLGDGGPGNTPFDLSVQLRAGETLHGEVLFSTELFDAGTVGRLAGHLRQLLLGAAARPGEGLWELPLLTANEAHQLRAEWGEGPAAPAWSSALEQFAAIAALSPEASAVLSGGRALTYRELDRRSNQLARWLLELGVAPEVRVGLFLARSIAVPVAILATWKAGGAYLPLDPKYPGDRLRFMVEDGAPGVMVTERALAAAAPGAHLPTVVVDAEAEALAERSAGPLLSPALPRQAAYVIYTSGSTGRPKGVVVPHLGLGNLAAAQRDFYAAGQGSRVLQLAALSFDAAVSEIVMALCAGGALCMEPAERLLPGPDLLDRLRELEITHLTITPGSLAALPQGELPRLAVLVVAGEAWPAGLTAGWSAGRRLINGYGPTEATVAASWWEAPPGFADRPAIGRPLPGTRMVVLDSRLQPVPSGAPGEICLGGYGLARGYHRRPGLTAERFVPDPGGPPGERLYRTGDAGRTFADGRVEFLGRLDRQVKLRGFRIELGEIEAALCALEGVRGAAVVLREDRPGEPRLAGYWVGQEAGSAIDGAELRRRLAATLPDYMVPAVLVRLESLPLDPTGKVDRRALPAPAAAGGAPAELAPPRTALEESLLGLWSEVLGVPRLGIHDDFFALGGHSLLATRLISRVRAAFQVELPLRDLFEAPTVAGLAHRLEAARRQGLGLEAPPLARMERAGSLPLSFAQQRLWFLSQLEPQSTAYNMVVPLAVKGRLGLDRLDASLSEVLRRHEVLRTSFAMTASGEPELRIGASCRFRFQRVDLRHLAAAAREAELRRVLAGFGRRRFDLETGPMLRGLAVRLAAEEQAVLVGIHHVASDAWSMEVLTREVIELYRASFEGRPARLPELPIQYSDYAAWQRGWLSGEVLAREVAHWRQALAGAPEVTELPLDRPRRKDLGAAAGRVGIELDAAETVAVKELGRGGGATMFMVALAGFQALLARYSSHGRVSVGAPVAGRSREELEPLIGFFVNTLVMHVDLSGKPTFAEVLRRVREMALTAYDHQDVPFEKLVEELQPERSMTHSPFFQATFTLQTRQQPAGQEQAVELPGGLTLAPLGEGGPGNAPFDLVVQLRAQERLEGELIFRLALFDRATAERLSRQLRLLLTAAAADPDRGLWDLPLLAAAERHQLVGEWNDTRSAYPRQGLYGRFAAHAAAHPQAPAVVFAERMVTYGDLARQAEELGRRLRNLGIGLEDRVGICMERAPELFVGVLGALAAGAAYLPLDPGYPAPRLAFMVRDSGVAAVITLGRWRTALPEIACPVLVLDEPDDERAGGGTAAGSPAAGLAMAAAVPAEVPAEALACVIYTSGSTGEPKGIGLPHGAICRLVLGTDHLPFSAAERIGHVSNVSFDAATWEIWGALLHGAAAVGIPRQVALDPAALAAALEQGGVTSLLLTTALFNQVVREAPGAFQRLRNLLVGGEAIDPAPVRELLAGALRPRRFVNAYGPAECTTIAVFHLVDVPAAGGAGSAGGPGDAGSPSDWTIPIGRPIANTTAHVVDPSWSLSPLGAAGELWLGGDGLARGYLGRPDLTADRFAPAPWGEPGARLYRTGDRVRRRADGRLEFIGRLDGQVKLRGFRIELGEVEAALLRLDGVRQAVALLRQDRSGDPRLVAYFVGAEDSDEGSLRQRLAETLPAYMVPSACVRLPALPLTPNGKLDRRALPAPEVAGAEMALAPPRDELERQLVEAWSELLGRPVGIHDNFFEAGGHSLMAIRLMSKLKGLTGRALPVSALFHGPTVADLAAFLRGSEGKGASCLVPIQTGGDRPALFVVHGGTGQVLRYRELGRRFAGERPVYGLQSEGLDGEEAPYTRVEDMAAHYLRQIRGQQANGPYHLAGWSLGGLVAFAIACELEAAGEAVAFLGILDTHFPRPVDRVQVKDPIAMLATFAQDFGLDLQEIGIGVGDVDGKPADEQVRIVLERAIAARRVPADIELEQIQRLYEVFRANARATCDFTPGSYSGRLFFYQASEPLPRPDDSWFARLGQQGRKLAGQGLTSTRPWRRLLGGRLVLRKVAGHHFSMLAPPHVEVLASRLHDDLETDGGEGTMP